MPLKDTLTTLQSMLEHAADGFDANYLGEAVASVQAKMDGFKERFETLQQQFAKGEISAFQFERAMEKLKNATAEAAAATEKEIAAKQRQDLLTGRAFQGKAGQGMFQQALEDKLIAKNQAAFQQQVDFAFNQMFGFGDAVGGMTDGINGALGHLNDFGGRLRDFQFGGGGGANFDQAWQQITGFLGSVDGQIANLQNQIQLFRQNMQMADTYRGKRGWQEKIDQLTAEIQRLSQTPAPKFIGASVAESQVDPAFQGKHVTTNNVVLPNLTRLSQAEIRDIYDALDRESQRRGKRMS
jgi:hypothetical protein